MDTKRAMKNCPQQYEKKKQRNSEISQIIML